MRSGQSLLCSVVSPLDSSPITRFSGRLRLPAPEAHGLPRELRAGATDQQRRECRPATISPVTREFRAKADGPDVSTSEKEVLADAALVRRVVAGDEQAIEEFTVRLACVPRILRALNSRRGSPLGEHDLADLSQDTMLVLIRKLDGVRMFTRLEGWVFRVCQLELQNAVRRKRRGPLLVGDARQSADVVQREAAESADFEELYWALERIEPEEAAVVRRKCLLGQTFEQLSDELDISLGTSKTRYYRGLTKLQLLLKNRMEGSSDDGE